jgi:threonine aldolase
MADGAKLRQFASDNYSGICPEAWEAMAEANVGHAFSYGDDTWTERACDKLREFFEIGCEAFFVFNGTAANSLALASLCQSYHSVICSETAHIETDECGAPEFFSNGTKVLLADGQDGKVDLAAVEHLVLKRKDIHYPKPRVLSVTQATELGTVYSLDELKALGNLAKKYQMRMHMDGARFCNALATLGVSPKVLTWQVGVDVLCLGGTKNGMAVGEAVIFFDPQLANEFAYRCKQGGQLASKMRYLSAPWVTMLDDVWLRNAAHANSMAAALEAALREVPGVRVMFPRQANSVFVELPPAVADGLRARGWHFYSFIGVGGARLMCSWDTSTADIAELVADARAAASL